MKGQTQQEWRREFSQLIEELHDIQRGLLSLEDRLRDAHQHDRRGLSLLLSGYTERLGRTTAWLSGIVPPAPARKGKT